MRKDLSAIEDKVPEIRGFHTPIEDPGSYNHTISQAIGSSFYTKESGTRRVKVSQLMFRECFLLFTNNTRESHMTVQVWQEYSIASLNMSAI
jgi:hypothetical protein